VITPFSIYLVSMTSCRLDFLSAPSQTQTASATSVCPLNVRTHQGSILDLLIHIHPLVISPSFVTLWISYMPTIATFITPAQTSLLFKLDSYIHFPLPKLFF
jgi:hypothetical protein